MALLREWIYGLSAGVRRSRISLENGHARSVAHGAQARRAWHRSSVTAVLALLTVMASGSGAWAYPSSSGWTDGDGNAIGTGNGLVLTNFYGFGQNATYRQKWLGGWAGSLASGNRPAGVNTDLWCIESGAAVTNYYSHSWSTDTNPRARYLMWLGSNTWNSPDGRGAIQFLLYADAYPGLGNNNTGSNFDYESRVWAHADFTTGARNYVNAFRTLSTTQMHNTPAALDADDHPGVPTTGDMDGIGVRDAWGNYIPGLTYTLTVTGPAAFDATGTTTVTGTTAATLRNDAHPWTATGAGELSFTISYSNADAGSSVYVGSGGGSQDMVAGAGFGQLSWTDPTVDAQFMFQPAGDTQVPSASVVEGAALVDVFTPTAAGGTTWGIDAAAYVPVTYDWDLYDAGEVIPGAPVASAPAEWTLLESIQVVATAPAVPITSTFTSTAQAGHAYVFVVSFSNAAQPLATQGWFLADWSDQYGTADEVIYAPTTVTPSSVASSQDRGSDTALLDDVTFSGFPSDHGVFTGTSEFVADVATVQQRLYFFPEGLAVEDSNTTVAELVCDVTVPATNGTHTVDEGCAIARKDAWGQHVAGTYVWTSTFLGDARAGAFVTSVTDAAEQVPFTNAPLTVTTTARASAADVFMGAPVDVWDTATVSGFVPVGSTLEFSLYRFQDIAAPVCDATTLIATLEPVDVLAGPGEYSSERFALTPPNAAAVGFVETVRDADGNVLTEGTCGATTETLRVIRADGGGGGGGGGLARTGADESWKPQAAGSLGLIAGGLVLTLSTVIVRRRRHI